MRALLPLLLVACGASDDSLWWLSADGESADIGSACSGAPLHERWFVARMWTGDQRAIELDGRAYAGDPDGYDLSTAEVYNSGRAIEANLDLEPEGDTLVGDWRYDDTTSSGVTCATSTPVTLEPAAQLATYALIGSYADSTVAPEGCRGSLGDADYTLLLQTFAYGEDRLGAWMSPDPVLRRERHFSGIHEKDALNLSEGGLVQTNPVPNTMGLDVDLESGSGTIVWTQGECTLTLPIRAEER